MSGPKSSRYTLTEEQRRILAAQRELERRKSVAAGAVRRHHRKLLQIGSGFSDADKVARELRDRKGDDGGFAAAFGELEVLVKTATSAASGIDPSNVDSLEAAVGILEVCVEKADVLQRTLSAVAAQNEASLRAGLKADLDKGVGKSFADIRPADEQTIDEKKETLCKPLLQLKHDPFLPLPWKDKLDRVIDGVQAIDNAAFLKNYAALTVTPLVKECRQARDEYERCHKDYETLYAEYTALCELHGATAKEYPCCEASVEQLRGEIQRICKNADEDDEQAYISECLDEAMEEMGYAVLGSREVTKKNGRRFRSELYTYGEGTAVNVTYSSDGRIAMEIGGLDIDDRLPDARETAHLCTCMERFCGDFGELEKRLLARGVVLAERVSLLPPSADHAQIINTSDYHMHTPSEKLHLKKKRTAAKQKHMKKV